MSHKSSGQLSSATIAASTKLLWLTRTAIAISLPAKQLGKIARWFLALMLVVITFVLLARNLFAISPAGLEELKLYAQAYLVMLGISTVQAADSHVRVDVLYSRCSELAKAWINLLGHILLALPFSVFLFWLTYSFAEASFSVRETSTNPGGLPFLYVMKAALPIGSLLIVLQTLADIIKSLMRVSIIAEEDEISSDQADLATGKGN